MKTNRYYSTPIQDQGTMEENVERMVELKGAVQYCAASSDYNIPMWKGWGAPKTQALKKTYEAQNLTNLACNSES